MTWNRTIGLAVALFLMLPLGGCAPPADETGAAPGPAADPAADVTGVVRVVGSAPMNVSVVLEREGENVLVTGPLRDELRRLSGAEVAVRGEMGEASEPVARRQVRVADYRILRVNGEPVISGTVEGTSGGWTILRTPEGERVYLASAPEELEPGQKVWVQGPRSVIVQSYGVVR